MSEINPVTAPCILAERSVGDGGAGQVNRPIPLRPFAGMVRDGTRRAVLHPSWRHREAIIITPIWPGLHHRYART